MIRKTPVNAEETARKVELLLRLAEELRVDGKKDEARGALEQALLLAPADEEALFQLALANADAGNRKESTRLLRKGLARKSLKLRAKFLSAMAREVAEGGRPRQALVHIRKAAALEPDVAAHHFCLGLILNMMGRTKDAAAPLTRAAELDPAHLPTRRLLAGVLLRSGRAEESIPHFVELVKREPRDFIARAEFAEAYSLIGKYIRASKQARLASRHCPDDFQSHYDLGTVFGLSGAGEFAILHLQRAIELNPGSGPAWSNLSAALLDCGEEKKALRAAKHALDADPEDARAWCNLGEACGFLERYAEAVAAFERAAVLDRRDETNARQRLQYARQMMLKDRRPDPGRR